MTQKQAVLARMEQRGSISTFEAFTMGITRLSARIYDLRQDGVKIESERIQYKGDDGKQRHYDLFRLAGDGNG